MLSLWEIRRIEHGRHVADVLRDAEFRHAAGRPWTHWELLRNLYSDFDAKHAPRPERYWVVTLVCVALVSAVLFAPWWLVAPPAVVLAAWNIVRLVRDWR